MFNIEQGRQGSKGMSRTNGGRLVMNLAKKKLVNINLHIGKRPIPILGNSGVDN